MFGVLRPSSPVRETNHGASSAPPPEPRSLAPMPDSRFGSRDEVLNGVKDWAAEQGYAVVIARSRFNRLWLKCDRGGSYENRRNLTPDQRKRKRGESRLLGCPFKMIASVKKDGTWHVETDNPEHNHGPSDDLSAHPTLRRMTDTQLQKVHDMCDSGNSPSETMEELRRLWPDIKVLTRDVYNARKKHKTLQEEARIAAGLPPQEPVQDPNGLIPGPNDRGRWAWVPDGEEVTNKKRKRKQRTDPAQSQTPTLDPQLSSIERPISEGLSMSVTNQQLLNDYRNSVEPSSLLQTPLSGNDPGAHIAGALTGSQYRGGAFNSSPVRPRSDATLPSLNLLHRSPAPTPTPTPQVQAGNGVNGTVPAQPGQKPPSGQILMARIERMEKDQRDQKNMLTQILGAVQVMSGSPGGSNASL